MYFAVSVHCISIILIFQAPWHHWGEIDKGAHRLFYTKFNFQQLLSEAFFHEIRIFGVSVLCAYWHIYNTGYVDCNDVTIRCPLWIEPTCLSIHLAINPHLIGGDYITQIVCHWLPTLSDIGTLQHKHLFVVVRINMKSIVHIHKKDWVWPKEEYEHSPSRCLTSK